MSELQPLQSARRQSVAANTMAKSLVLIDRFHHSVDILMGASYAENMLHVCSILDLVVQF
jgi:hypothetical protein